MSERILKTEHITQRFGGLVALSDISMEVNSGEIVGIIGPNGAGKSTLFNVITGMYNPTEGKVEMLGQDVTGWKPYRITELGFSRTFQNIRLFPRMTVQDNVIVGMHTRTKGNIFSGVFFTKKERRRSAPAACGKRIPSFACLAFTRTGSRWAPACPTVPSASWRSPVHWPHGRSCCFWTSPPPA